MSSYAGIYVNGKEIFSYRNEVREEALHLFSADDLLRLKGRHAVPFASAWRVEELDDAEVDELQIAVFRIPMSVLRDRLDVFGFGEPMVRQVFDELREIKIGRLTSYVDGDTFRDADIARQLSQELDALRQLDYGSWRKQVGDHLRAGQTHIKTGRRNNGPLELFEEADERVLLRAIVGEFNDADIVSLDVSELDEGGWLDSDEAVESVVEASWRQSSSPPIIITEGTFDAYVLRNAIEILRPHLAGYIRFLDYEVGNEGGASSAVRTLKSFAAAGISNRIVALFDNDSAAYEAVMAFRGTKLPSHYRVMHYPDLPLAEKYPTLGPQGNSFMNVNRLAGSIELYLGADALAQSDGSLMPVQWKGYMGKVKSYQGEVVDKAAVQRAFKEKIAVAKADPKVVEQQDWSGLECVLDKLMETLSSL